MKNGAMDFEIIRKAIVMGSLGLIVFLWAGWSSARAQNPNATARIPEATPRPESPRSVSRGTLKSETTEYTVSPKTSWTSV